jgi:hypothetical protein
MFARVTTTLLIGTLENPVASQRLLVSLKAANEAFSRS